jgi:VanZ family protein
MRPLRAWAPAAFWAAVLIFLSSRTSLPVDLGGGLDKVAHFTAYSVLGFALGFGQTRTGISPLWVILAGSGFGAVDELFQGLVPNRTPAVGDWVADTLGVIAGVGMWNFLHRWYRARTEPVRAADERLATLHD